MRFLITITLFFCFNFIIKVSNSSEIQATCLGSSCTNYKVEGASFSGTLYKKSLTSFFSKRKFNIIFVNPNNLTKEFSEITPVDEADGLIIMKSKKGLMVNHQCIGSYIVGIPSDQETKRSHHPPLKITVVFHDDKSNDGCPIKAQFLLGENLNHNNKAYFDMVITYNSYGDNTRFIGKLIYSEVNN
jgi:hypothetical protein